MIALQKKYRCLLLVLYKIQFTAYLGPPKLRKRVFVIQCLTEYRHLVILKQGRLGHSSGASPLFKIKAVVEGERVHTNRAESYLTFNTVSGLSSV